MKKNIATIMILILAAAFMFTGCAPDNGASISTRTVRVIGTVGKTKADTRALAEGERYTIASVDSVVIDGKDIKDELKPVGPVAEGQNNVTFIADVEVKDKVSFSATPQKGFVFDEWEVLEQEDENEESRKAAKAGDRLLEEIEDWLEVDGREHQETLKDIPSGYIPYLVAEYDHGFHIALAGTSSSENDGSRNRPYTVDEFIGKLEELKSYDELTLVISGTGNESFKKLMTALNSLAGLEELKLKAEGATISALPEINRLEELSLTGFTFPSELSITDDKIEYKFEDCTFGTLLIDKAGEIEISGGKAGDIKVTSVDELEVDSIEITGRIDLSAMKAGSGEVELENIPADRIHDPNHVAEIEMDQD